MDAGFHRQIESRAWWTRRVTVQGAPAIDELGPAGLGQQLIQPGGNGLAGESLPPPMVSQPQAGTVVTATWSAPAMRSSAQVWPPGVRQGRKACSMLEGLWSGRFAVAASSWWSWAPCLGPSSGLFLPWPWRTPRLPRRSRPRGRARGAALAAHPPSSQPTASQTAGGGDRADGDGSTNSQRTEPADRPNNGHGNAGKDGQGRQDKPGNGKPGKGGHGKGKDK